MRRIAVMNQKGGVGKTTTTANLGAALALQGRRVVLVDMDAQANLSLSLNVEVAATAPSSYTVLLGSTTFEEALRPTSIPGLRLVASHLDLSGAELELAATIGREYVLRDALRVWAESSEREPADYVLFDCPPSLGLLSINALAASREVLITLQTEFLALQGMSKLIDVVQLLRRRLNPELVVTGILPCLYDSRLKLAREVLGEIRAYFPGQVLPKPVRTSVKLAEAPSYGRTIFEYAPESHGAHDYMQVASEIIRQESRDPALAGLPPFDERVAAAAVIALRTVVSPSAPIAIAHPAPAETRVEPARDLPKPRSAAMRKSTVAPPAASAPAPKSKRVPVREVLPAPKPAPKPTAPSKRVPRSRAAQVDAAQAPAPAHAPQESSGAPPAEQARAQEAVTSTLHANGREHIAPRRSLRADDYPPLPPDAFEILTTFGREG